MLNSSVPNAWALPGGKIAVNRGLAHRAAQRGGARGGARSRDRARRRASRREGAGARHAAAGGPCGGHHRRGRRRRGSECRRARHSGRGPRRAARADEVRPRPGAGSRRVRHEVHEDRRLRPVGRRSRCRRRSCGSRRRAARSSRASSKGCSPPIRLRKSAWRRTSRRPKRSAAAAKLGDAKFAARVKPLLDDEAGVRQARQGGGGRAQEGLRAGEAARERGACRCCRRKRASSRRSVRSRSPRKREEGHRLLREGDSARSGLLRRVSRRGRRAVPRGQQGEGGRAAGEELKAPADRAGCVLPRRARARAAGIRRRP